jgi:hypothetical protein
MTISQLMSVPDCCCLLAGRTVEYRVDCLHCTLAEEGNSNLNLGSSKMRIMVRKLIT